MADLYIGPNRPGRDSYERIIVEDRASIQLEDGAALTADDETSLTGVNYVRQATVTLTNDQIKAMPGGVATEGVFPIVAAQGADTLILPTYCVLRANIVTSYTNVTATTSLIGLIVGSDVNGMNGSVLLNNLTAQLDKLLTTVVIAAGPRVVVLPCPSMNSTQQSGANYVVTPQAPRGTTDVINHPLQLYCYNDDGDFTGGNAANTLQVSVLYLVWNISTGEFIAA